MMMLAALALQSGAQTEAGLIFSGFLHDAGARALKPIMGVPGAAYLSAAIVPDVDAAWPSPNQEHAVVLRGGRTVLFAGLKVQEPQEVTNIRLIPQTVRAAWSARGGTAVLYSPVDRVMQIVRVSRESVTADAPVSLGFLTADVSALAVADSGRVAVAAGDEVYIFEDGAGTVSRRMLASAGALTFCAGERLFAAAGENIVELDSEAGGTPRPVVTDLRTSGLTCAARGNQIVAVDAREPAIAIYETDGTLVQRILVDRQPSTILPIQSDSIFLLNGVEQDRSPAFILNVTESSSRVFFVPVGDASSL